MRNYQVGLQEVWKHSHCHVQQRPTSDQKELLLNDSSQAQYERGEKKSKKYPTKQDTGKQSYTEGKDYDKTEILVIYLSLFTQHEVFNKLHCKTRNELAYSENRY